VRGIPAENLNWRLTAHSHYYPLTICRLNVYTVKRWQPYYWQSSNAKWWLLFRWNASQV